MFLWFLVALSLTEAAAAASIDAFAGQWQGQQAETTEGTLDADKLSIDVTALSNGFEIAWHNLAQLHQGGGPDAALAARFARSNRQGVFELVPAGNSFIDRMFATPTTGNPLDGETLLWARLDEDTLAVYSLSIDQKGGFMLDHYSWTKTENGLNLRFRGQSEELGREVMIEGQLVPAGE